MIRDESYIHIWWWMLSKLKLKWNELLVYATIYSFTNGTDEHCYKWSAWYLSERCGLQRRQTMNILKSLENKWYIERKVRTENWIKFVDYYTPYAKIAQGGYVNFAHHNNSSFDNNSIPAEGQHPMGDNKPSKQNSGTDRDNVPKLDKSKIYVKDSNDVRDVLSEEQILQYNTQLKILLKMIGMWYKVEKKDSIIIKEMDWLKAKANLYGIKKPDWQIAWQTFLQRIDKRVDWHIEKNKQVKNFKTSIIPFISKP